MSTAGRFGALQNCVGESTPVTQMDDERRKAHSYFDNAQLRCVFGFYENDSLVSYGVSNPG